VRQIGANKQLLHAHVVRVGDLSRLPLVQFDAMLLERVFSNLLENAAKYTPPGSVISIDAQLKDGEIEVSVADNGPGIAPGSEETIFEKFTRGQKESPTPGVGLGLAVSKAIVEAHRGRMWAETAAGGGARFVFTLPRSEPPSLDLSTLEMPEPANDHGQN
jgi:two-component system sensor histidine kinase KdpD